MAKRPKKQKLSDQVRAAIETCGQTRYRISRETGIPEPTLSRFMTGGRGLRMRALDILADYLNLNLTMAGKPIRKKGR